MAHLQIEKLKGRNGGAAGICSGSYIYGLNGKGTNDYYGSHHPINPEEMLTKIRRCAARRALMVVGNEQRSVKLALKKLLRRRAIRLSVYPWSGSAKLVVARAM